MSVLERTPAKSRSAIERAISPLCAAWPSAFCPSAVPSCSAPTGGTSAGSAGEKTTPVGYAIEYLRGRLAADDLRSLRVLGGLQAYPSRRKNPSIIDLSTGSMGLGAVTATFAALAGRYVNDHWGARGPGRFITMPTELEGVR